ncbi:hypothetical protein [Hoyosella subflava]|uniref:Hypothetical membrane protein n=1 Tax=Hoyosella subflava (strain DSM 45089 / JCM 17490 / NBRC 109087 / DQS3-9A1) TaxID=443218 RepID=F6EQE0_HOYSD|nr:hypothetical protein [Hoyosella subflava]AEF40625.1 Hypothetical membrane protein [Hoyosella subflava DQS3-9A1]
MLFGRPGGPVRTLLALVAVGVLGLLSFVVFDLNRSLDNQIRVNVASVGVSHRFLGVNDKLTKELEELARLTGTAQEALDSTAELGTLLTRLDEAIAPVAASLSGSTHGAQVTTEQLAAIAEILGDVHDVILPMVDSAQAFGDQGKALSEVLGVLVADLQASVESAATINDMLPLPG